MISEKMINDIQSDGGMVIENESYRTVIAMPDEGIEIKVLNACKQVYNRFYCRDWQQFYQKMSEDFNGCPRYKPVIQN